MIQKTYPVCMEIAGSTALFARPDSGDNPTSYPAPTYAAVKGIFEAVLWGPAVEIVPQKVELCSPICWHSYAFNYGGPLRKSGTENFQMFATVLIDVCYRLYANVIPNPQKDKLPETARKWDRNTTSPGHAYQEIFNRRLKRGQSFDGICLGWKEFTPSYFGPFRNSTKVMKDLPDIHIPSMLRQTFSDGYQSDFSPSYDMDLVIHEGCLVFPDRKGEQT